MKRALGSLTLSTLYLFAACLFLVGSSRPAHADGIQAFNFSWADYRIDDPDTAELGYDFTVGSSPITVLSLGYINDGFNGTHVVELFNVSTQQAVPGAIATVTTLGGGGDSNTFTYTNLASPVTLAANTQYQIVSQFFENEYYFTQGHDLTSQPGLTMGDAVYGDYVAPPASPNFATGIYPPNDPGDFGPNFTILSPGTDSDPNPGFHHHHDPCPDPDPDPTPVPELSSLYLVATGLFSFGASRFRRSL